MTLDDKMGAGIVGIVAVFAVGILAKGHVVWSGTWMPVLAGVGLLAAAGVFLAIGVKVSTSQRNARTRVVHFDAGEWADAARHEAGHIAAAKKYGAQNVEARIYKDGSGWTSYEVPPDTPGTWLLAVDYAGGYAEGSWKGCGHDLRQADALLRRAGMFARGGMERKGRSLARSAVGGGRIHSYRRRLERTGRYRDGWW